MNVLTTAMGAKVRVVERIRRYSLAGARGGRIRSEATEYRVTVTNGRQSHTLFERFSTREAAEAFVTERWIAQAAQ